MTNGNEPEQHSVPIEELPADPAAEARAEQIKATEEMMLEAKGRMIAYHLSDPEAFERAFHDMIEAESAHRAYADAYRMVTGYEYAESDA